MEVHLAHNVFQKICTRKCNFEDDLDEYLRKSIAIRRNPSLETRATCTSFSVQLIVHVQT